jgi:hypothetical protein
VALGHGFSTDVVTVAFWWWRRITGVEWYIEMCPVTMAQTDSNGGNFKNAALIVLREYAARHKRGKLFTTGVPSPLWVTA